MLFYSHSLYRRFHLKSIQILYTSFVTFSKKSSYSLLFLLLLKLDFAILFTKNDTFALFSDQNSKTITDKKISTDLESSELVYMYLNKFKTNRIIISKTSQQFLVTTKIFIGWNTLNKELFTMTMFVCETFGNSETRMYLPWPPWATWHR